MNVATDGFLDKTIANEQETIKPPPVAGLDVVVKIRANYLMRLVSLNRRMC